MTESEQATPMSIGAFVQQVEFLRDTATQLGIHFDLFLTRLYSDGQSGTDYVRNHENQAVREQVRRCATDIADGHLAQDERHPSDPETPGGN